MKLLLDSLKPYGFNERRFTELDLYNLAEREKIQIIERGIKNSFYINPGGAPVIALGSSLKGLERTFALGHEIAHHLLHSSGGPVAYFYKLSSTKEEAEADALSLIALIPIRELARPRILNESEFAWYLYEQRKRLYYQYGV
jgi:Zn-dependent peptidase ImmA (M78 family)